MNQQLETLLETGLEIAVIGMAGRFPGASTIDEFWENLKNGVESIAFLSDDDLKQAGMNPGIADNPGFNFVRGQGGALPDWEIQTFDAAFFGYTPMEAQQMLPQTRLFHMCLWEALEDSGYTPETANKDGAVGLYAGASGGFNWETLAQYAASGEGLNPLMSSFLNNRDFMASLIAYRLNLRGPGFTLHTACSTSLVAIHLACQGLLAGDCDMALAGGVAIRLNREKGYLYQEGMIMSPDGHCRPFDKRAAGTVAGDGAGVVVLKRLEDAIQSGDNIYAIIKGSAINNDGDQKVGYTAPGVNGQADVIRKALRMAEVEPHTLSYIECHGTATALGDVTEIEALMMAFNGAADGKQNYGKKYGCAIGSVKSNIGHLDIAAGVAGFIKAVLALKHGQIPPSLHFQEPNPAIPFDHSPFYVNHGLRPFPESGDGGGRRAGVSSFGIGGTNAHVLLEEWPGWPETSAPETYPQHLLLLSAPSEQSLEQLTVNLGRHLESRPDIRLQDAAFTLQQGRKHFPYRRKIVCADREEAIEMLSRGGDGSASRRLPIRQAPRTGTRPPIVFMFPGLGSQYCRMGEELYQWEPVFRQEMDQCFDSFKQLNGVDLKEIIYPAAGVSPDHSQLSKYAQSAVFIFQYALAKLMTGWGIQPDAMIGYSFGEYAAACIAGVFSPPDALKLLAVRTQLLEQLPAGAMLSVPLPKQEAENALNECFGQSANAPVIGIDNGASCVVSGPAARVAELEEFMKKRRVMCFPMDANHAIHSPMMQPLMDSIEKIVSELHLNEPLIPYVSSVTGDWIVPADAASPHYWARQLREPVKFAAGLDVLLNAMTAKSTAPGLYLEVGTGHDVSALVKRDLENHDIGGVAIPLAKDRPGGDIRYLTDKTGAIWQHGAIVDWLSFQHGTPRRVSLPATPFQRGRYWKMADDWTGGQLNAPAGVDRKSMDLSDWFYIPAWKQHDALLTGEEASVQGEKNTGSISCWLIFSDDNPTGLAASLAEALKNRRPGRERVELVAPDKPLNTYEDYEALLKDLKREGLTPHRIIHCLTVIGEDTDMDPEEEQRRGFYSLLALARALGRVFGDAGEIALSVLSTHVWPVTGEEQLKPGLATLLGPCRVIPQEYPHIRCKHIDLTAELLQHANPPDLLLEELEHWPLENASQLEPVTAYRGARRWAPVYEPRRLEASQHPVWLKDQGVYMIIGGLGDIGFTLARYLVEKVNARIVITGRTLLPRQEMWDQFMIIGDENDKDYQAIQKLKQLQAAGGDVLYRHADVANENAMTDAFEETIDRFGAIDGVIHSAGVISGDSFSPIDNISLEHCALQARAKIDGLKVLKPLLLRYPPGFCLLISSISTVLGGLGFVAYSAVNHYMDAFAARENPASTFPWLVVDWDGATPEHTAAAFERIFSSRFKGVPDPIIFSVNGGLDERIRRWVKLEGIVGGAETQSGETGDSEENTQASLYARPDLSSDYVAPRNRVEKQLAQIWQNFFGIEEIGVKDDLFELGGDSLKAINIISIIHKEMNVTIPIRDFFDHSTIEAVAAFIGDAEQEIFTAIQPMEKKEYYPLSSAQKRLYILQQLDETVIAYNTPHAVEISGDVDPSEVEQVFRRLIQRHEVLRTAIAMVNDEAVQVVFDDVPFDLEVDESGEGTLLHNFLRPFNMSKPPFLRGGLVKTGENRHVLLMDIHHIVTDAVSHSIFIEEFLHFSRGGTLPPLHLQYKDFACWQEREAKTVMEKQEKYWLQRFAQEVPMADLPYDFPRPPVQQFDGANLYFTVPPEETRQLSRLSSGQGVTLFMTTLALFNVLLSKLSGQTDIVVGTPVVGRRHADLKAIMGMFVNTLAFRNRPLPGLTFNRFLQEVKSVTLEAYDNQEYPFEDLVDRAGVRRDTSRNPLFDVMFMLQTLDNQGTAQQPPASPLEDNSDNGLFSASPYNYEFNISKFDLSFHGAEEPGGHLSFRAEYCTRLFKEDTIHTFFKYFRTLIANVLKDPEQRLEHLDILEQPDKDAIMEMCRGERLETNEEQTIHGWFEDVVSRQPGHLALVGPNPESEKYITQYNTQYISLSFAELNRRANALARHLSKQGVRGESMVALMVERSPDLTIAMLAVMKSGGAYLAVDPALPENRKRYMLEDGGAAVLLTNIDEVCRGGNDFVPKGLNIIDTRTVEPGKRDAAIHYDPGFGVSGANLVYVIYTSGSTGQPKGLMVEHRNMVNLYRHQFDYTNIDCSRILQFSTIVFDVAIHETGSALLSGGSIHLIPNDLRSDVEGLFRYVENQRIRTMFLPISFLKMIFSDEEYIARFPRSIRHIQTAGEQVVVSSRFRRFLKEKQIYLHNHYGPAETHVVTTYTVDPSGDIPELPSIGKPILNTHIYILDPARRFTPAGVAGELCVAGLQVGRGYWNKPGLTAEKFIPNPFTVQPEPFAILPVYLTGDLSRWLSDGNIEFLGRIDHQVKIRGFRIELGEIEGELLNRPDIKEAVVTAIDSAKLGGAGGDKRLCAYLVCQDPPDTTELRTFLANLLPDYMVPSFFVFMEKLPHTVSGKVDRKALPMPETGESAGREDVEPPANTMEAQLLDIWSAVLDLPPGQIGVTANFFSLGGHSLRATVLISKIHRLLEVKLPLGDIFKYPTIRALAAHLQGEAPDRTGFETIEAVEKREYYPQSPAQRRLYLLHDMEPGNIVYNMPEIMVLAGGIDQERLTATFRQLIARHEVLRTTFLVIHDELVQRVHDEADFSIRRLAPEEPISAFVQPFDLTQAPLARVGLQRTASGKLLFMTDMHHIIGDGLSMNVLVEDFMTIYSGAPLEPLRIQYKDYSQWYHRRKSQPAMQQQARYWLDCFAQAAPPLTLNYDFPRPPVQRFDGASLSFQLPEDTISAVKELAGDEQSTLFMALFSLFTLFLSKISGQRDIVVGTPVAGREHDDLDGIIGIFIDMLPLRSNPDETLSFREYLRAVKQHTLDAFENQSYPYEDLLEELDIKRDVSRNPLFDVVFSMHNWKKDTLPMEQEGQTGLNVTPHEYENTVAKFDLTLYALEMGRSVLFTFEYCTHLFKGDTIEGFKDYFRQLARHAVAEPDSPLWSLCLISAERRDELLEQLNANLHVDYPKEKTLHQLFREQAARTPDNIALAGAFNRTDRTERTYKELEPRSNELAARLQARGVRSGDIVAIKMERSLEMIEAILAVLQAGAAYLPIDPGYPEDRAEYMLKDSAAKLLILQSQNITVLQAPKPSLEKRTKGSGSMLKGSSSMLAYIIYTSGSTGKPKGVMVEHRNVVRLLFNDAFQFDFNEQDVWTLFHSISFDFSVWEIFGALLYGGKLVIVPKEIAGNAEAFARLALEQRVTVLNQIPGIFINVSAEILKRMPADSTDLCVRYVIFGGEALNPVTLKEWKRRFPATRFINMYGITETTVHVTYKEIGDTEINEGKSNIGKPIPTLGMVILDDHFNPVPPGVTGEILVSGDGVARGYLNRPQLTAERFVPSPFTALSSPSRVYRSGDLGMLTAEGDVIYMGRKDQQVKIRGFRIELGEIESRLLTHPAIAETVVTTANDSGGDRYLCAYIVLANGEESKEVPRPVLREYLSKDLPDYMIPSYFVPLERLPLTASGKVDRGALPEPFGLDLSGGASYIAPRNELERELAAIWQEVLNRQQIGIGDDFFEIGGHSLKAARVTARIQERLKVKVSLLDVFQFSTIAELAPVVEASKPGEFQTIFALERREYYEPSHSQKRLWVLDQLDEDQLAYNIPGGYYMEGDLNIEALSAAFKGLIARHESLRTTFLEVNGEPKQRIHSIDNHNEDDRFKLDLLDLTQSPEADKEMSRQITVELSTSFDLSAGPLFRSRLLLLPGNKYLLLVNMHHIVADGWSMDILVNDLIHFYNSNSGEATAPLPELRIQYKDYAAWQNKELAGAKLENHQRYWLSHFRGEPPVLELVTDSPRPANKTYQGAEFEFKPGGPYVRGLKEICLNQGATMFMGVLSVLYTLFYRYTSQQDIILGAPAAERQFSELENQVGCYLNTLALRTVFSAQDSFYRLLNRVKETTLGAFEHQVYPFDHLVDQLDLKRDMSRSPLFDVLVVMQNAGAAPASQSKGMSGLKVSSYRGAGQMKVSKFDLTFYFTEIGEDLLVQINYNVNLFRPQRIQRMAAHFTNLLKAILSDRDNNEARALYKLVYLDEEEKKHLLEHLNDNDAVYPAGKTIQALFQDQAAKTPDHTALVSGGENKSARSHLSYRRISALSGGLAVLLRRQYAIEPGQRVALLCGRSPLALVALLAVIETGAAFVPIDTGDPASRIRYILQDSHCTLIITDISATALPQEVTELPLEVLSLPAGEAMAFPPEGPLDNSSPAQAGDLSYIVYTSGSTGRPKGVPTTHRAFCNFIFGLKHVYRLQPGWRFLLSSSLTFDASYRQIFLPLTIGASLHILKEPSDVKPLLRYMRFEHIGVLYQSPVMWREILDEIQRSDTKPPTLSFASSSGDVLSPELANRIKANFGVQMLVNMYGPTETCMVAMHYPVEQEQTDALPLGYPFPNYKIYLLDAYMQPVPAGVAGEICIAGPGVARGYLNQPQLTAERFIPHPSPLYKTGDIGVFDIDGSLRFMGRRDAQVKVRGVRIELGEIETVMTGLENIDDAVAVPVKGRDGATQLAAYYISGKNEHKPGSADLRAQLSMLLPTHMIPAFLVPMETFPLTNSGKIDRKALPDPQYVVEAGGLAYLPPRDELEEKLAVAWGIVLERDKIGITDDFFDLGGDSLKAIRLIGMLSREFKMKVRLRELFRYPSIAKFAAYVTSGQQVGEVPERAGFYQINNHFPRTHTVICFPPMIGFAFNFHRLKEIIRHPLVLFNMLFESLDGGSLEDNEALLEEFNRQIGLIDIQGPLVLVGWSAGGKLAYEVCRVLEKHGVKVDKLVLIDANKIIIKVDDNHKKSQLKLYESRLRDANTPQQEISDSLKRMSRYYEFCMNIDHTVKVNADIFVVASEKSNMNPEGLPDMPNLVSEDTKDQIGTKWWGDLTNGSFELLMGHGLHREMLDERYVEENARIINNLIFGAREKK